MPRPTLRVGSLRIPFTPRTVVVACPCGAGTIAHHYAQFAGGAHEPPSEDHLGSDPCPSCGCEDENHCDHQPAPEDL